MVKDYQEHVEQQASPSAAGAGGGSVLRGVKFKLAALALAGVTFSAATGFLMVQFLRDPGSPPLAGALLAADTSSEPPGLPRRARLVHFRDWPQPDLVLVLSAQQHGHLQECGCSTPQRGSLVRRFNLIQGLKDRGWKVVALDLGDIAHATVRSRCPTCRG